MLLDDISSLWRCSVCRRAHVKQRAHFGLCIRMLLAVCCTGPSAHASGGPVARSAADEHECAATEKRWEAAVREEARKLKEGGWELSAG